MRYNVYLFSDDADSVVFLGATESLNLPTDICCEGNVTIPYPCSSEAVSMAAEIEKGTKEFVEWCKEQMGKQLNLQLAPIEPINSRKPAMPILFHRSTILPRNGLRKIVPCREFGVS